jgi:hypothetical protein
MATQFADKVQIFVLLYGDFFNLHARILSSLRRNVPGNVRVWIWCNKVCDKTIDYLTTDANPLWTPIWSSENTPKYVAMREMFAMAKAYEPLEWYVWFDDDSWIEAPDWFDHMQKYIEKRKGENVCYIGQSWIVHHLPGQWEFITQAKWYKGKPSQILRSKPGVEFAQGAYWWLRRDVADLIDWPDERLKHNGGDTLLGEAIRQQGLPFHKEHYGVKINDAKRRGYSEKPAGSTKETRR